MPATVKIVDKIDVSPTTRLDLNDGTVWKVEGTPDFTPPPLKRSVADTMLREGAKVCASAYENRVLGLDLHVKAASQDALATQLQTFHREMDRAQNIIKYQPVGSTNPVFFRTWRSPDYERLEIGTGDKAWARIKARILAEPFAYGLAVQSTGTIYNDPAAGTNPISFQITGVTGDVPTPLYLFLDSGAGFATTPVDIPIGVRRHGTPALYFKQCEAMTPGTDTTLPGNDGTMSGTGSNYARTSFATATAMTTRLTWDPCPAAGSSVDYRGTYRVFVRVRRSANVDDIYVQLSYGAGGFSNDIVEVPHSALTGSFMLDLGLIRIPPAPDPTYDGYTGTTLPAENTNLQFKAARTGTETLDWDYAVLVPADEELGIVDLGTGAVSNVWDGPNDWVYEGDMTQVVDRIPVPFVGSIPLVSPNQTNLYVILIGLDGGNGITWTLDYTARWWPRWLYVRP